MKKAIDEVLEHLTKTELTPEDMQTTLTAHALLLAVHTKALGAHCECLGMNAENMWAAIRNTNPPYDEAAYNDVLRKWDLLDDDLKVKI